MHSSSQVSETATTSGSHGQQSFKLIKIADKTPNAIN